jgi:GNAT superfamily N-acetyltransferase
MIINGVPPEELPEVSALIDRHLGVFPGRLEYLTQINPEKEVVLSCRGRDGKLLGGATATCLPVAEAHCKFPTRHQGLALKLLEGVCGKVGFADTLAVDEMARGKGVGAALLSHLVQWLDQSGTQVIFAHAWIKPQGGAMALPILQKLSFQTVCTIARFWEEETFCSDCGVGESCACSAIILLRHSSNVAEVKI